MGTIVIHNIAPRRSVQGEAKNLRSFTSFTMATLLRFLLAFGAA
jgi:hypothetical protein